MVGILVGALVVGLVGLVVLAFYFVWENGGVSGVRLVDRRRHVCHPPGRTLTPYPYGGYWSVDVMHSEAWPEGSVWRCGCGKAYKTKRGGLYDLVWERYDFLDAEAST